MAIAGAQVKCPLVLQPPNVSLGRAATDGKGKNMSTPQDLSQSWTSRNSPAKYISASFWRSGAALGRRGRRDRYSSQRRRHRVQSALQAV